MYTLHSMLVTINKFIKIWQITAYLNLTTFLKKWKVVEEKELRSVHMETDTVIKGKLFFYTENIFESKFKIHAYVIFVITFLRSVHM